VVGLEAVPKVIVCPEAWQSDNIHVHRDNGTVMSSS